MSSIIVKYPTVVAVCQIFFYYKQVYSIINCVCCTFIILGSDVSTPLSTHTHVYRSVCLSVLGFYVYRSVPVVSVHAPLCPRCFCARSPLSSSILCTLPSVPVASVHAPLIRLLICASSTHTFIDLPSQYNHCSYVYWSVPVVSMLTSLLHLLICPCHIRPPPTPHLYIYWSAVVISANLPLLCLSIWPCHFCVPSTSRSISAHFYLLQTSMSIDLSLSYRFCMLPLLNLICLYHFCVTATPLMSIWLHCLCPNLPWYLSVPGVSASTSINLYPLRLGHPLSPVFWTYSFLLLKMITCH